MICTFFFLFCGLSLTLLMVSFEAKTFNFEEVQFIYFFVFMFLLSYDLFIFNGDVLFFYSKNWPQQ